MTGSTKDGQSTAHYHTRTIVYTPHMHVCRVLALLGGLRRDIVCLLEIVCVPLLLGRGAATADTAILDNNARNQHHRLCSWWTEDITAAT